MLNDKELKIIMYYMEEAIESYSDYGCNDLPNNIFKRWTKEEKNLLKTNFKKWYKKKNKEDFCDGEDFNIIAIPNDDLVKYFIDKYKGKKC